MISSLRRPCLALSLVFVAAGAVADDWPNFYGPLGNGTASATGVFASLEEVGLQERWRRPLGNGYAVLTAVGDRVFTTYSGEVNEYAVALDVASGKTVWETSLGPVHRSTNAADDGVLASPAIGDGGFYTTTADGVVFALSSENGEVRWKADLVERLGAQKPFYGFSASPLIDGPRLIVQAGGEGANNLVALDRETGATLWTSYHAERHTYATPLSMEIDGVEQVVALAGSRLIGVEGETGRLLWSLDSPETEPDRLLPIPGGRVFSPLYQNGGWMVAVERDSEGWTARELWLQPSVRRSHGVPVYHDGAIYAFQTSLLLCLDAETGDVLWRERVYDGNVIKVDGRLVLLSRRSGDLHLLEPSRAGYRELLRESIFEAGRSSFTPPTFAGGALLLRNQEEAVALEFSGRESVTSTSGGSSSGSDAVLWRLALEDGLAPSGRSRVAAVDGTVYTLVADTETEHLLAASADRGERLWSLPLAPLFENASNGARGEVIVAGERLLAITTACVLHAVSRADGEPQWRVNLLETIGGAPGSRGCETSPAVSGDLVVVHAAGEESRRVVALDLASGDLVWSNDEVERPLYTSPRIATVDGVAQAIVHTWSTEGDSRSRLQGLRLEDGSLLWSHDVVGDWSWRHPLDLGEGRFLVSGWNRATALQVVRRDDTWAVEQMWQDDQLVSPVRVGAEVCGSRRGGLSCVSIESGDETRRAEIGTVRLEVHGSTLAAVSYDGGTLSLFDVSGSGLEERLVIGIFNAGAVNDTSPTFAGDRIYLRNHEEMVAVRLR